jgi:hypothetical protein
MRRWRYNLTLAIAGKNYEHEHNLLAPLVRRFVLVLVVVLVLESGHAE